MNKQQLLDTIIENHAIQSIYLTEDEYNLLQELCVEGLVIRCSDIPHNMEMLNPSYTYVTNDIHGRELALQPLFTLQIGG